MNKKLQFHGFNFQNAMQGLTTPSNNLNHRHHHPLHTFMCVHIKVLTTHENRDAHFMLKKKKRASAEVDKTEFRVSLTGKKKDGGEKKKQQHMLRLRGGTPAKVMV